MACLPFLDLTADQAAASTATATWWQVFVSSVAAVATISAVAVALFQQRWFRKREDAEATRVNRAAKQAIFNAIAACRDAEEALRQAADADLRALAWVHIGRAAAHSRTLQHYLGARITSDPLVFHANATIQRLYEVDAALKPLTAAPVDSLSAQRDSAAGILSRVLERIAEDEPAVLKAEITVRGGMVPTVAAARGRAHGHGEARGSTV